MYIPNPLCVCVYLNSKYALKFFLMFLRCVVFFSLFFPCAGNHFSMQLTRTRVAIQMARGFERLLKSNKINTLKLNGYCGHAMNRHDFDRNDKSTEMREKRTKTVADWQPNHLHAHIFILFFFFFQTEFIVWTSNHFYFANSTRIYSIDFPCTC